MPAGQIAGVLTMCTMLAICSATLMGKYLGDSEFHRSSRVSCLLLGLTGAAMTMQSTELTNLALDCDFATKDFAMARINTIFMRADQVRLRSVGVAQRVDHLLRVLSCMRCSALSPPASSPPLTRHTSNACAGG